jgi:hypothetical protein
MAFCCLSSSYTCFSGITTVNHVRWHTVRSHNFANCIGFWERSIFVNKKPVEMPICGT